MKKEESNKKLTKKPIFLGLVVDEIRRKPPQSPQTVYRHTVPWALGWFCEVVRHQ